jgi:OOP family OmpA-OmpF porin
MGNAMAESLFASLLQTVDRSNISQIASSLGESEYGIRKGLESSVASVLAAIAVKAEEPDALRRSLDLVPENAEEISWSSAAADLSAPDSWINRGERMLSSLFAGRGVAVASAVRRESGVGPETATTLLAITAPMVLRFLSRLVRDESLSMWNLGTILQSETPAIQNALPTGVRDLFWPHPPGPALPTYPVVAQSAQPQKLSRSWLAPVALTALALGVFWLWTEARKPIVHIGASKVGEANRMAPDYAALYDNFIRRLPNGMEINVPAKGIESQLLSVIDGNSVASQTWLESDRFWFDSGSSVLPPNSPVELDNIAAILKAYPAVHLQIAGFTDSVGAAGENLALSLARAEAVKSELVSRGISPDRLTTRGFGEESPAAANTNEAGRGRNRHVSFQVTQSRS